MKHKKEWYTCNRCGNKINEIPSNVLGKVFKRMISDSPLNIKLLTTTRTGYVSDEKLIAPNIAAADIIEFYKSEKVNIHLCGKCRKAFKKFMDGDSKMCKFCKEIPKQIDYDAEKPYLIFINWIKTDSPKFHIDVPADDGMRYSVDNISFCPYCGRKLV